MKYLVPENLNMERLEEVSRDMASGGKRGG